MNKKKKYFFCINELSLLRFCIFMLIGRCPYILVVESIFPQSEYFLNKVVDWGVKHRFAERAVNLTPDLKPYLENNRRFYFKDVPKNYEAWQREYFNFASVEKENQNYGYVFKLVTNTYIFEKVIQIYMIKSILSLEEKKDQIKIYGVWPDTIEFFVAYFSQQWAGGKQYWKAYLRLINVLLCGFALVFSIIRLCLRTRFKVTKVQSNLAVDLLDDPRERHFLPELFKNISRDRNFGPILCVQRVPSAKSSGIVDYGNCIFTDLGGGAFSLWQSPGVLSFLVRDIIGLYLKFGSLSPRHFYHIAVLPDKKMRIRALLNKFPVTIFLGRDEYNPDHILRGQELGRIGSHSFGLSNTFVNTWTSVAPNVRYVSYDKYFVYSHRHLSKQETYWDSNMKIFSTGCYGIPKSQLESLSTKTGDDILVSVRIAFSAPEIIRMVRQLSKAFPKKTILLRFVEDFIESRALEELEDACMQGLSNITVSREETYSLFPRCRYFVSDVSTIIAEAIQAKKMVFFADVLEMSFSVYRLFPGLSVRSAEELVDRVSQLETGKAFYPHNEYINMLGLSQNKTAVDIIGEEIMTTIGKRL